MLFSKTSSNAVAGIHEQTIGTDQEETKFSANNVEGPKTETRKTSKKDNLEHVDTAYQIQIHRIGNPNMRTKGLSSGNHALNMYMFGCTIWSILDLARPSRGSRATMDEGLQAKPRAFQPGVLNL